MCVGGMGGGEPWVCFFFSILHFLNSFLLCSPERQPAEWNEHLTFAKCWRSGPETGDPCSLAAVAAAPSKSSSYFSSFLSP